MSNSLIATLRLLGSVTSWRISNPFVLPVQLPHDGDILVSIVQYGTLLGHHMFEQWCTLDTLSETIRTLVADAKRAV